MAFGKIKIGKSWHNRLFVKAYIEDSASWRLLTEAEWNVLHDHAQKLFAEEKAEVGRLYEVYHTKLNDLSCKREDHEVSLREYEQADGALMEKKREWFDAQKVLVHERNAQQLRERYEAGLVSLCPYFHSVWWALLWYVILIPAGRATNRKMSQLGDILGSITGSFGGFIVNKIETAIEKGLYFGGKMSMRFYLRFQNPIDNSVAIATKVGTAVSKVVVMLGAVAIILALLFSAGKWAVDSVNEWRVESAREERQAKETEKWNLEQEARVIRQAAEFQRLAKEEAEKWQAGAAAREAKQLEDTKLRAEKERLEALERQQFLRDNPDIAAQERAEAEQKVQKKRETDAKWAEMNALEAQREEIQTRFEVVNKEVDFRRTLLMGDLALGGAALLILIGFFTVRFVIPFGKRVHARMVKTSFVIRTNTFAKSSARRVKTFGMGIKDTAILVGQFLRASYRGICPYIEFEKTDQDR